MARILVVEDHADSSAVLLSALRQAGHGVVLAPDGRKALDLLVKKPADLIVLDLRLPLFDGTAFLHVLRSYLNWHAIPVIVVSAGTDAELERAEQFGVFRTFRKANFRLGDFVAAVEDALRSQPPGCGASAGHGDRQSP